MTFSSYNPYNRYKRRLFQQVAGVGVVLLVMFSAFMIGYFIGHENSIHENISLNDQVKSLETERDGLQSTITDLRAQAKTANLRYEEAQKTTQTAAPTGANSELVDLVNKEVADGMDPQRISFLIRSNHPPRNCADPMTQRFIVSTPAYKGVANQASIASGAITVKASGASTRVDNKGEEEAWFDPTKPVTLEFAIKDGRVEKKQGIMPISYSAVLDGREYRFTVSESARSFAKVTYDSCDYP